MFTALPCVTSRLGMAARPHHGHAQRYESIRQWRFFASAQHNSDLRKADPQGADQLRQLAVAQGKKRPEIASRWAQPGNTHADLGLPTAFKQILKVRCQRDRFILPA